MEEYINKADLLVQLEAEIDFAKLTGNFSRVTDLAWAVAIVKTAPILQVYKDVPEPEPTLYRYTEERE